MLTKRQISIINEALESYLDSAEGFPGFSEEDRIQNAWDAACDAACDYAASASVLGDVYEEFLTVSEENLREACWDNFVDYYTDITSR